MKRTFAEIMDKTMQVIKGDVKQKIDIAKPQGSVMQITLTVIALLAVCIGLYLALDAPDMDVLHNAFLSMSAMKFFACVVVVSWLFVFLLTFLMVLLDVAFLFKLRTAFVVLFACSLPFFMIFVLNMHFVNDYVEAEAMESLEEVLGTVTPQTFIKREDGSYFGTAHVEESAEGSEIEYVVHIEDGGKRKRRLYFDINYQFVHRQTE